VDNNNFIFMIPKEICKFNLDDVGKLSVLIEADIDDNFIEEPPKDTTLISILKNLSPLFG
jgi:hypothetical protein